MTIDREWLRESGTTEEALLTVDTIRVTPGTNGGLRLNIDNGSGKGDIELYIGADGYIDSIFWERPLLEMK